ncbi:MAG: ABC transporter permease, partial [Flavobacteriales bacterium]|nr:ABC transporter permease [Flavobacteriales bacterium]
PQTTFQRAFNFGNKISWYAITAQPSFPLSAMENNIMLRLAERHGISPDDEKAFGHFNAEESMAKMMGIIDAIKFIITIVGSGTLLAGIIGISNIMLIVVKERTKEIGIRRAIGATPNSIISQIISESILLTLIAGLTGLFIGVTMLETASYFLTEYSDTNSFMFVSPEIQYQTAIVSLGLLIIAGILAGLIPAYRAVSIKPVDALRDE